MHRGRRSLVASLLLFAGLCGCVASNTNHEKADAAALKMDDLRATVVGAKEKVLAAAASTSGVVDRADSDPRQALAAMKSAVANLDAAVSQADSQLQRIQSQTQSYFGVWEQQTAAINDPDLKKRAESRRADLAKTIDDVAKAMAEMHSEVGPFVSMLKDLQIYWSNDLSPAGVKSVSDKADRARKSADSINEKLDEVVRSLDAGAPEFRTAKSAAPGSTPPPPPSASKPSDAPASEKGGS